MKKMFLKNAKLVLENKLVNGSVLLSENKIDKYSRKQAEEVDDV